MSHTLYPKIYVACLRAYNNGKLHGAWIDAAQDPDAIMAEVNAMLKESPSGGAEEWAIHDYEDFGSLNLGESEDIASVSRIAIALEEHGAAFAAYADNIGIVYANSEGFEEAFRGEWDNLEAYGGDLIEDMGLFAGDTSGLLERYFDYQAFARDLELGGDVWTAPSPDGQIFVFDNH